jgi:hypothetical protein
MIRYEYKVIPAPRKGEKSKTARTTPDRFANTLTLLMNRLGAEGWEYLRADTLPCEERVGLTGRQTTFQPMLIFRRALAQPAQATPEASRDAWPAPEVLASMAPAAARQAAPEAEPVAAQPPAAAPMPAADPMDDAARRTGVIPTVARPVFGATPGVTAPPLLARRGAQASTARAAKPEDAGA